MVAEKTAITKVIGVRGLKNLGGRIQEEYLTALKSWSKEVKICLEMRDDTVIGTLLDAIKLPLLAADFDVIPGGSEEADIAASDFLWANLNSMERQTWRRHVSDMLEALDFGFAIGEIVLEKRDDGKLWLKNIDPRGQETLEEWVFGETDTAITFVQRDPDTGKLLSIPLARCIHVAFRGRKGNPQGKSLLRSLYYPWRFLRDLEVMEAIGIERDVGGMPIAQLPEEPLSSADFDALKASLKGMRNDEELFLIVPNGLTVTPYGGGSKMYNVAEVILRKQKEILMYRFAQFLMLGMEKVGTQALVEGSQDFFMLGLLSVQQELLDTWNQQLVPLLLRYNAFPVENLPVITWANPGKPDLAAFMAAYTQGVGAKLITPLREDEEKARAVMDLPDLPEGEGELPRTAVGTIPIEVPPPPGLFGK